MMERSSAASASTTTTATTMSSSSDVQLRRLCRHILGSTVSDEVLSSKFRSSVHLLSSSASGQLEASLDEMAVVEKMKKYLIRDGRDKDIPIFVDLHQRLKQSSIIKNRLSILTFLLNLSERTTPGSGLPRRIPFPKGSLPVNQAAGSGGHRSENGHLTRVVTIPYRSQYQDKQVNGTGKAITPTADGLYHPPLPPKPKQLIKQQQRDVTADLPGPLDPSLERELLRELILVFQGIEGVIIRRDVNNSDDFATGFGIAANYREKMSVSVTHLVLRLAELGWMFNVVHDYCEKKSSENDVGLICQSFVTALKEELCEFYQFLTSLENEFLKPNADNKPMGLHQLSVFTLEPMLRLRLLSTIVQSCGKLRGGALVSGLYNFLHNGDPRMSSIVHKLLTAASKPLYLMILRWVMDGLLEDPFVEFFIASDNRVQDESRLWHDKYSIRRSMIPTFLGLSWVKKILSTGKSINFLHAVCQNNVNIPGKEAIKMQLLRHSSPANLFADPIANQFLDVLDRCYKETSSLVLDVLFTKYKFLDHVTAMRKYLLLGQGDLIRYLLELLDETLCQPATHLYPHNLASILETAIRATNTQYEDPDILERLDVRLLNIQPGDTGWDVFSLDYKVQGPIGTVFSQSSLLHYLMLFNSLWRAKRMEWILSCVWTRQTGMHKMMNQSLPELKPILHLANLLSSEMVHFVHQLAYYTAFEVMECSWDQLIRQLKQAENLDEVIEAHNEFLETLVKRALLDERSRDVLTQLRAIYDRIVEFSNIQNKLYTTAAAEFEARLSFRLEIEARERRKEYGLSQEEEDADEARRLKFAKTTLPQLETQLKIIWQSYQDMVKSFLTMLNKSVDQSLRFLCFRLDFNEHYKKKDTIKMSIGQVF